MRSPAPKSRDARALVGSFESLWRHLFRAGVHLDSALAKLPAVERARLAVVAPLILRAPISVGRALGVRLDPAEPWSLAGEALATWTPAARMARELLADPALAPALDRELEATVLDYPPTMIASWRAAFGDERTEVLARVLGHRAPLALRASRRLGADGLLGALPSSAHAVRSSVAPLGVVLKEHVSVSRLPEAESGGFEIQDEGSQLLACFALEPELVASRLERAPSPLSVVEPPVALPRVEKRSRTIVDACAGAGGKTLALADLLGGRGRVFAYDVSAAKLRRLRERAARAGLHDVKTQEVTSGAEDEVVRAHASSADVVLVDAPCSGWGVLRRNPDAKWRLDAAALARLPELQARLLATYTSLVKPGGRVVYAVCTFRPEETVEVVERVLAIRPDLVRGPGGYLGPGPTDGFFVQALTTLPS